MTYQVKLEVFEGPFDLLLTLIARRKLDVTEVDLAEITADFLVHLTDQLEDLDLETATRFLVVAATLVELKAARLLPAEERQELEELLGEARDVLYARLLEYRAFRDVARVLAHRLIQHEGVLPREVPLEPWIQRLTPETPLPIDAAGLAALAAAAISAPAESEVDLSYIRRTYLTIREAALEVLEALPEPGRTTSFRELVEERDRGDRVVLFLALLELFKLGHVDLDQPQRTSPLQVERREGDGDLADLTDEDDADPDGENAADEDPGDRPGAQGQPDDRDDAPGSGPHQHAPAGAGATAHASGPPL